MGQDHTPTKWQETDPRGKALFSTNLSRGLTVSYLPGVHTYIITTHKGSDHKNFKKVRV